MLDICYSGGATGADTLFGECAEQAGHQIVHYSFKGHRKIPKHGVILSQEQLNEADPYLKEVNKWLKRSFPCRFESTTNLLRRNYWQIKDTEKVYAISEIDEHSLVKGGTAWAVHMAILRKVPCVWVFDQAKNCWFMWRIGGCEWHLYTGIPNMPCGKYTGIGTRDLKPNGIKAIKELYGGNLVTEHNADA